LQASIDACRSQHSFDASGVNHAARLTIDLAAGGRYVRELKRHATTRCPIFPTIFSAMPTWR
jgi:hypothetical protein